MLTTMSYRRHVRAGAAFLDTAVPGPWRPLIDLNILDMSDDRHCVIGQIEGRTTHGYTQFVQSHGLVDLDNIRTTQLGFTLPEGGAVHVLVRYRLLTACWTEYLLGMWL
jgi:hypothetical protein